MKIDKIMIKVVAPGTNSEVKKETLRQNQHICRDNNNTEKVLKR